MRLKLLGGAAALLVMACTLGSGPAAASMYYPWGGQFPWDRPGTVNPDVISGWLLATSAHWPALNNFGSYESTLGPSRACRYGRCRDRW